VQISFFFEKKKYESVDFRKYSTEMWIFYFYFNITLLHGKQH